MNEAIPQLWPTSITLNEGWRFREVPAERSSPACRLDWLPATVPGHVHLDLMRAGVIHDPFYRLGERGAAWVDQIDWVYETTFTVDDHLDADRFLRFNGLDTVAEIHLNGELLGATDNMFIPHEFPVSDRLRDGVNTLQVLFRSAMRVGAERQKAWDDAGNDTLPFDWFGWNARSFVRKAQYMFGWDWGPEPVSCGIWRPVELITVPVVRILDWRYDVALDADGSATVAIEAFVERTRAALDRPLEMSIGLRAIERRGARPQPTRLDYADVSIPTGAGRRRIRAECRVPKPCLWEPSDHRSDGSEFPPMYLLDLYVMDDDHLAEQAYARIGLRTIDLVQEPDADESGASFKFRVNGHDLFAKGANWIPASSFPATLPSAADEVPSPDVEPDVADALHDLRATLPPSEPDRIESLLLAAHRAGMNMLRVWGGGFYESERFYSLCDELGILVWQDFPYACAYYPDTGVYADAARAEATAAVRRLRSHASLACWCGNNENHQMFHDGWGGHRPPRLLGEHLYHEVLPAVVDAEDPGRPYLPSSPYGGENPNAANVGDRHDWDVWHGVGDWVHYPEDDSRFLSEFGFASSCGMAAWDACLAEMDKEPRSPAVRWHDKTRKGYETYLGYVALHYPESQTLEDLVYYSQLNQADALKCGIEHWRRRKGRCWGALFWQLNDCWPVQSWSVIDSAGEPKAAYYASARFFAPVLLSLVRSGDAVEVHLTNDTLRSVSGTVSVRLETFEGERIQTEAAPVAIDANGTARVATLGIASASGRERDVLVHASFAPDDPATPVAENVLFLAEPKDLRLADPGLAVDVGSIDAESFRITLSAKRFAPSVWLRLEGDAAEVGRIAWSDNFFHLLPGATREVVLRAPGLSARPEEARTRLRIRTL